MNNAMVKATESQNTPLSRRRLLKWGAQICGVAAPAMISLAPSKARAYGSWSASGSGGWNGGEQHAGWGGDQGGNSGAFQDGADPSSELAEGLALARVSARWSVREERELQMLRSSWQMPGGYGWRRKRALQNQRNDAMNRAYVGMSGSSY